MLCNVVLAVLGPGYSKDKVGEVISFVGERDKFPQNDSSAWAGKLTQVGPIKYMTLPTFSFVSEIFGSRESEGSKKV